MKFTDGTVVVCHYQSAIKTNVINPSRVSCYGVGFIGQGVYNTKCAAYQKWVRMLQRCYDLCYQETNPAYKGCIVCEEWHNFQNFAKWFYSQPNHQSKNFQLDKDLTLIGNKTYCPEYCSLVPKEINSIFQGLNNRKGRHSKGVYSKSKGRFSAVCRSKENGKNVQKNLGTYGTEEEAFNKYKEYKEEHIKSIAKKYVGVINDKVYKNIMNYKILKDLKFKETR